MKGLFSVHLLNQQTFADSQIPSELLPASVILAHENSADSDPVIIPLKVVNIRFFYHIW